MFSRQIDLSTLTVQLLRQLNTFLIIKEHHQLLTGILLIVHHHLILVEHLKLVLVTEQQIGGFVNLQCSILHTQTF